MFGNMNEGKKSASQQFAKAFGQDVTEPVVLGFSLDLGAIENPFGLTWRFLPGSYASDYFCGRMGFIAPYSPPATGDLEDFEHGANMGQHWCASLGNDVVGSYGSDTLGGSVSGCFQGILGSIFTTYSTIYILSSQVKKTFPLDAMIDAKNPFEYNGFIWFSALLSGELTPVIGYIPPIIYGNTNLGATEVAQRQVQYFSIEQLGVGGQVGLYKGNIVVATNKGLWTIVPGSDEMVYVLGQQLASWNLGINVSFGISHDLIVALDEGDLYVLSEEQQFFPNTRFDRVKSNGSNIVLSGAYDVAVSNGRGFESFQNLSAVGSLLVDTLGDVYVTEREVAEARTIVLETTMARFPRPFHLKEIIAPQGVLWIEVDTDRMGYRLHKSLVDERLWRAGMGGMQLKLRLGVSSLATLTPLVLKLAPRSAA